MTIELTLTGMAGKANLTAMEARRDFASGSLLAWSFHIDRQEAHHHLSELADLLEGPTMLQARSFDVGDLGPMLRVSVTDTDRQTGALVVSAAPVPFVLRPDKQLRRRVLLGADAAALLSSFANVVALGPAAANTLQRLKFPERCCVIQDGLGDFDQVRRLLRALDPVQSSPDLRSLMCSGRSGVQPGWTVTWLHGAAYRRVNAMKSKTISLTADDGHEEIVFEGGLIRRRIARPLSGWQTWAAHEPPLFTDKGGRVHRLVDRLYVVGGQLRWDTDLHIEPDALPAPSSCAATPWTGTGVVEQVEGIWMRARLTGFEKQDDSDLAYVQLTTPYSGLAGAAGLNITPEHGTTVKLQWSGRLGEPLYLDANVREKKVSLTSPSLEFEKPAQFQFDTLSTKVAQDVKLLVGGTMSVESKGTLDMKGDGASTRFAGGKVKSGGS